MSDPLPASALRKQRSSSRSTATSSSRPTTTNKSSPARPPAASKLSKPCPTWISSSRPFPAEDSSAVLQQPSSFSSPTQKLLASSPNSPPTQPKASARAKSSLGPPNSPP